MDTRVERGAPLAGEPSLAVERPAPEGAPRRPSWRSGLLGEALQTALLAGALFLITGSAVEARLVDGPSMQPNLFAGERLVVDKLTYLPVRLDQTPLGGLPDDVTRPFETAVGGPRRGDVVVLRSPTQPDVTLVKRLIGLPGDSVLIRNGQVFVNGVRLEEPYIQFPGTYTYPASGRPLAVPAGRYFVLGDNRPVSYDSHSGWLAPAENLIGRVVFAYWPPRAFGWVR